MSEEKKELENKEKPKRAWYVLSFFAALAVLTVVAFIIPLRPTQSYAEKRSLARFPEFSVEALVSGSYFDDITTWFSDTFPGREGWLEAASRVEELHGVSDVYIQGNLPMGDQQQVETEPTEITEPVTEPEETAPPETVILQEIEPPTTPIEEWGGVDAGDNSNVSFGDGVIQVEDSAFDYMGFSEYACDKYIKAINSYVQVTEELEQDVNIVVAPIPIAIGIMVEEEYQEKLYCTPQDTTIDYLLEGMDESVVKVDMFQTLIDHNDEYLYFRTDHHWTALGAYYAYEQIMLALGKEPAPLDSFEQWDQGEFQGSLYYRVKHISKLRLDNVTAYVPEGDIKTMIYNDNGYGFEWPLISDMSQGNINSKYMCFIAGDHALTVVTNESLPDAPNCVIIKESFGNAAVPFFTQNYHNVYVVDYRELHSMKMRNMVEEYDITDVIFLNNLSAVQNTAVSGLINSLCR